jgi:catechol 2,3-dioxygenase-like lactoylglutathione lyase family enzyme
MKATILRVLESCLYVDDLTAAEEFYCGVLGLEFHSRQIDRHVFLRCGESMVLLFLPEHTEAHPSFVNGSLVPVHGSRGAGHLAFAVEEESLKDWRRRFEAAGISIESEVHWPAPGGHSLYLRDPAGNSIELATPTIWG